MGHNKSSLFAGQGPPSRPPCTSQALGSHESCPSSFTKFFLLLPPLPGFPPPLPFSEKNPLSVSDAWPYSKAFELAIKHPNAPALLCPRDLPACAGRVGCAPGTSPKSPRLPRASQRCSPGCCASSQPHSELRGLVHPGLAAGTLGCGSEPCRSAQP